MQNNITTVFIGTDREDRIKMLGNVLLDNQNILKIYNNIMISLDCFNGNPIPDDLLNKFKIIQGSYRSQVKNISNMLNNITSEWILYCEDDTVIDYLPDENSLNIILNNKIEDRECGMLSMNAGGSTFCWTSGNKGDLTDPSLIIKSSDNYIILLRDESKRSNYFFSMPGVFIRKEIFEKLHNYCIINYKNSQIECALSKAWFDLGIDKKYYKATMGKKNLIETAINNPSKVDKDSLFLRFLDENTGSSSSGGCNSY